MKSTSRLFGIVAILAIALAATAIAVPVTDYTTVKVDGTTLTADATNRLALERDNELSVEVAFIAGADATDLELEAFVSGYEYSDSVSLSDSTGVFDVDNATMYVKRLTFTLPDDVEQDSYKLRVMLSDRNGVILTRNYNLLIEGSRHEIKIMNVGLSESRVKSGSALLATVRIENQGQLEEKDIKVVVSVPSLGISATDYIDSVKVDRQKDTEEMYLRLPTCAKAGVYQLTADVSYSRGHETLTSSVPFEVVTSDTCTAAAPTKQDAPATTVVIQPPVQPAPADVAPAKDSTVKTALEVILLVLIGLVVVIGIVLGLSRMGKDDEEAA